MLLTDKDTATYLLDETRRILAEACRDNPAEAEGLRQFCWSHFEGGWDGNPYVEWARTVAMRMYAVYSQYLTYPRDNMFRLDRRGLLRVTLPGLWDTYFTPTEDCTTVELET